MLYLRTNDTAKCEKELQPIASYDTMYGVFYSLRMYSRDDKYN